MDISDLYSPQELAQLRVSFLTRLIEMYDQGEDPFSLARAIAHKIHGTGGNLGISGLLDKTPGLHEVARQGRDAARVQGMLAELRVVLATRCEEYTKEL